MAQFRDLHKLIEPFRREEVSVDGMSIPRSAAILLRMLDEELDSESRDALAAALSAMPTSGSTRP